MYLMVLLPLFNVPFWKEILNLYEDVRKFSVIFKRKNTFLRINIIM